MLPKDLVGVCRLCSMREHVTISIFENESKEIYYKISACLPITISVEDKLPKKICLNCFNKVNMYYDFWNQTLDTEKNLLSWLNAESENYNNFNKNSQTYSYSTISESNDDSIDDHNVGGDSDDNYTESDPEGSGNRAHKEHLKDYEDSNVTKTNQILTVDYQDDKPGPSGFQEDQSNALKQLQGLDASADVVFKKLVWFNEQKIRYESKQEPIVESTETNTPQGIKLKLKKTTKNYPTSNSASASDMNGKKPKKKVKMKSKSNDETIFKCRQCDEEFDTSAKRSRHEKSVHAKRDVKYDCDKCSYSTYTKGCFTTHLKRHIKQYTLFCEECNVGFFNNTELTSHNIKLHDMQPFQCAICNDLFTSKGNLYSHIKSHDPNNSYVCEICGRTYKKKNSYKRHIARSHLGLTTKAQCLVCEKILSSKEHLRRHMLTHTDERNWVCSTCGKCFLSKTYLTEHSRIHLGIRPYKCEICEKCFTQRGSLTIHKRSHTGERPFRCQYCNKGFVMSTLLRYHLKKCGEAKIGSHFFTHSVISTVPVPQMDFNMPKMDTVHSMTCDKLESINIIEPNELDPLNNCAVVHSTK